MQLIWHASIHDLVDHNQDMTEAAPSAQESKDEPLPEGDIAPPETDEAWKLFLTK